MNIYCLLLAAAAALAAAAPAAAQGQAAAAALAALELLWTDQEREIYHVPGEKPRLPSPTTYARSNGRVDKGQLKAMVIKAARMYNIPPALLCGLVTHESQWQVNAVNYNRNRTHDMGIGQLNSATWESHLKYYFPGQSPFHPWTNIQGAALFLRQMYNLMPATGSDRERWRSALMAYNMGPRRILDAYKHKRQPPEIGRRYAARVLALSRRY